MPSSPVYALPSMTVAPLPTLRCSQLLNTTKVWFQTLPLSFCLGHTRLKNNTLEAGVTMPRVLVVDDEPNILLSLEFLMQQAGFEVTTAEDAERAQALIQQQPPDLILLDISLPGMSGFDLLEQLRAAEATADLPVIMLTAHGREVEKEKGMALGASDYITKPFSTRELVSRVEALLGSGNGD